MLRKATLIILALTLATGLVFGLALSVASTVVLLKALQDRHLVDSDRGRIAVGWLIVEDLVMVISLVLIPPLGLIFLVRALVRPPLGAAKA